MIKKRKKPPLHNGKKLDSLVKTWIYGSITTSILQTILQPNVTAAAVWKSIKELFHDNKEARSLELEDELHTLQLGTLTMADYFQRIKVISDLLRNIGSPVKDNVLLMYAINGLDDRFESLAGNIRYMKVKPTFLEARSMLIQEEKRLSRQTHKNPARDTSSSPTVLMAASNTNRSRPSRDGNAKEVCRNFNRGRCTFGNKCKFLHTRSSPNYSGQSRMLHQSPAAPSWTGHSAHAPWAAQPSRPPQWAGPLPPPAYPYANSPSPSASQAYGPTGLMGPSLLGPAPYGQVPPHYQPTALPNAFAAGTLAPPLDHSWYMDTAATSHLNADTGLSDPQTSTPM